MTKKLSVLAALSAALLLTLGGCAKEEALVLDDHPATDAYQGWRLGSQAYTFRMFTFFEAVDKVASLGMDWIEAYSSQRVSAETGDLQIQDMTPDVRNKVRQKLRDAGVRLVNYGVITPGGGEEEWRKVFEFARDMDIETIMSEPKAEQLDLVDQLAQEYQIPVAFHNHPKPSIYWDPDVVLSALKGRSKWLGACGDTGHWMRSGIDPVEALKKLKGHIFSLHFKDLNEFGVREAHDVPWGSGKADVPAILAELKRQGYQGTVMVEYEHNWENSVPEIRQSANYFRQVANELYPGGWKDLFAADLSNANFKEGSWTVEDGVLTRQGGSYIWSQERYGNFILDLEYKVAENTNSGVFIRAGDLDSYVHNSIEVQIHENSDGTKYGYNACIYDCLAPSVVMNKPAGVWNHYTITAKDNKIYVVLNGVQVIDMDLDLWATQGMNPDSTDNKFKKAIKDMPREGHIGFQDHGQPIWFRNVRVKEL